MSETVSPFCCKSDVSHVPYWALDFSAEASRSCKAPLASWWASRSPETCLSHARYCGLSSTRISQASGSSIRARSICCWPLVQFQRSG